MATALVQSALADLRARGFLLAQAVLDESAGSHAGKDLARGGMPRVTELLYLERDTTTPLPLVASTESHRRGRLDLAGTRPGPGASLEWRPFEPALEPEFRSVLMATYVGSLDMPELEGARSLEDILEGHRASGRFVAERWRLGRIPGEREAAAVLLMAEVPDRDVWEVVYLGLTPPARGRGLGRATLSHALELARPHVSRLELAVDLRNRPAMRLYQAARLRRSRPSGRPSGDPRRPVIKASSPLVQPCVEPSARQLGPLAEGEKGDGGGVELNPGSLVEAAARCRRISPSLR